MNGPDDNPLPPVWGEQSRKALTLGFDGDGELDDGQGTPERPRRSRQQSGSLVSFMNRGTRVILQRIQMRKLSPEIVEQIERHVREDSGVGVKEQEQAVRVLKKLYEEGKVDFSIEDGQVFVKKVDE